jgi:Rps23 Pro-64 3,4-dihydroxylase Tpa1-like proline 4-hydroxylase
MNLFKNIDNKVFIFENVLDESIIDLLLANSQKNIKEKKFVARFGLKDVATHSGISFNKLITDLNEEELYLWNNFKNNGSKLISRKDIESTVTDSFLVNIVNEKIKDYLKTIYSEYIDKYYSQTEDILTYYPGHLMSIHSDGNQSTNSRICTTTLYLNKMKDKYEGGEIIFYDNITGFESKDIVQKNIIYTHRPQRNQLIVFDSYFNKEGIQHSVSEIKNWNRDVFRTYWQETPK